MVNMNGHGPQPQMGQHPGMQGMPGGGGGMKQQQVPQIPHFAPSYVGFMLRRGLAPAGQRGDWLNPQIEQYSITPKQAAEAKAKVKNYNPLTIYNELKSDAQRQAISTLLQKQRALEKNFYATWDYYVISPKREKIAGSLGYASLVTSITVILRKQPKTDVYSAFPPSAMYGNQVDQARQFAQPQNMHGQNFAGQGFHKEQKPKFNGSGPNDLPPPPHMPGDHPGGMPRPPMNGGQGVDLRDMGQMRGPNGLPPPPGHNAHMSRPGPMHPKGMNVNGPRNSRENMGDDSRRNGQPHGFVESDSIDSEEDSSDFSDDRRPRNRSGSRQPRGIPGRPLMTGAGGRRDSCSSTPPILKKKISTQDITTPRGERRKIKNEKIYRRPRSDSGSSDSSYDHMSDVSRRSRGSTFTDYSRDSHDSLRSRRRTSRDHLRGDYKRRGHHSRSHSRDRRYMDKHGLHHDPYRISREFREHRKPSPGRGLSPARDSDSDRDRGVHVHIHNNGVKTRGSSPSGSSTASLYRGNYPVRGRRIQYPDNDAFDMADMRGNLPPVPMVPTNTAYADRLTRRRSQLLQQQQRRREMDAEAYIQEEVQRAQQEALVQKAINRGRRLERDLRADDMFDDPVERERRRYADRDWEDIDWSDDYNLGGSSQKRWNMTDDLLSSDYVRGGYGNAGSKRNSFVDNDARYGNAGRTRRGARHPLFG